MKILVVGASGAKGRHLVNQLLFRSNKVRIIVRSKEKLPKFWDEDANLGIIIASL